MAGQEAGLVQCMYSSITKTNGPVLCVLGTSAISRAPEACDLGILILVFSIC